MPQISPMNWIFIINSMALIFMAFLSLMPGHKMNKSHKIAMALKHKSLKW